MEKKWILDHSTSMKEFFYHQNKIEEERKKISKKKIKDKSENVKK